LKILVDVRPPKGDGEFIKEAIELLKNLARLDHQNQYIILSNESAPFAFTSSTWNFSLDRITLKPQSLLDRVGLAFLLKMHRIDCLHSFSLSLPRTSRYPIILSLPASADRKVISKLRPRLLKRAKKILVAHEGMKEEMIERLRQEEEKIIIAPGAEALVEVYQAVAKDLA